MIIRASAALVLPAISMAAWLTTTPPSAQEPSASGPQSTFRSAVDLVSVDVNAIDSDGRPIDNLSARDFVLTVDGKPRRIASAEFIRMSERAAPAPASPYFSTNAHAASGRLIAIVIDHGNISIGRSRAASDAALRLLERLSPADRVGLYVIPGPGPQVAFTSNHALIRAQLPKIAGQAGSITGPQRMGLGEAAKVERGDLFALNALAARECTAGEARESCTSELENEARSIVAEARNRTRDSMAALRVLMQQLAQTSAPKTVVYISEPLVVNGDVSELAWIGPGTAAATLS